MAEVAYFGSAEGVTKKLQQDIVKILPDKRLVVSEAIKYDKDREFGGTLESVAFLSHEHGVTHIGTAGAGQDLEPSVVAESKPAQMQPTSFHMTTRVTAELASAASAADKKAYENYIDGTMRRLQKAARIRKEVLRIRGGLSIAQIATTGTEVTSTTFSFGILEGSFAPMIWIGAKNMPLDAYQANGTKINTTAALRVVSVTLLSRADTESTGSAATVVVSGAAADVDALVAAAADVFFYYRSQYGNVGYGISQIAGLTNSSSSYLAITPSAYPEVWTATQEPWDHASEMYTWDLLNQGIENAQSRGGLDGEEILCFPSIKAWRQLCSNMEALRVLDASYSATKSEFGHELDSVKYHAVSGAVVTLKPSACMPRGEVIAMAKPDDLNEICMAGSDTLKFGFPGSKDALVQRIQRTNYAEISMFAREDMWAPCPNQFVKWCKAA